MKKIKTFTVDDYNRAVHLLGTPKFMLMEDMAPYYSEKEYEERKIHNEHDKLVKKILEKPREIEFVVKKALGLSKDEKIEMESVRNEFITSDFRGKQADMVYKIKDKEVYILVEHQSTEDRDMPYRVLEYDVGIINTSLIKHNYKVHKYAKVISIVIFTGAGEWRVPQRIEEIQEEYNIKREVTVADYAGLGEYYILDINKLSKEELLENGTLFGRMMLVERARREEDLIEILEEILPLTKDEEREDVINILRYILVKDIGEDKAQEYIKKLEEGAIDMSGYVNYLRQDREATMLKMRNEGKSEGKKEGKKEGIKEGKKSGENNIIRTLFKNKMSAKEIAEKTGIALNEILKIVKT